MYRTVVKELMTVGKVNKWKTMNIHAHIFTPREIDSNVFHMYRRKCFAACTVDLALHSELSSISF